MSIKTKFTAAFAASLLLTGAAFAEGLVAKGAYARAATPNAKAGAAFLTIENHTGHDDTLIGASAEVAKRVELHTHIDKGDGVLQMTKIEEGITVPAGGAHTLKRGSDHVMLMGLTQSLTQGDTISVTLVFEKAGEVVIEVPVDNERKPQAGAHADHSAHSGHKKHDKKHGEEDHSGH